MELQELLEWVRALPPAGVYALLFASAFLEYVVPPVPGDTVVVVGVALVAAFDWPVLPVFGMTLAGSVLGSAVDFAVGRWLARTGRVARLGRRRRLAVEGLVAAFRRHGSVYLALNRFVPGVRALFFVAAGLAGVSWPRAMLWAGVSALGWNLVLVGLGVLAGRNIAALEAWVGRWNLLLGGVLVVLLVGGALVMVRAVRAGDPAD
jgi:membrane protein DedA with SNARE-associated domain